MSGSKTYKRILVAAAAVVIAAALVIAFDLTKPYAVYEDGTRVDTPYVVKADGEELFLVEDAETAERVIETVLDEYSPEGAQINSLTVDKKLTTDDKKLKRGEEPPVVLHEEEAVEEILDRNATDDPYFCVTINAEIGSLENIKAGTTYKKTDEMYEGESEVRSKGSSGSQIVTEQVISVNGAVLNSEEIDTSVINEASDEIVYKGTKERPKDTSWADYSGKVVGSGDGAAIASFALQFVGNPYKYGGTSLTNGADCSGFVQSVFSKFGISLPRTGDAQARCGKGVSLSEAKAGDLVYYPGHIAIYIGGGKIVHAANPSKGICVSGVHTCGRILTVRRIVE